MGLGIITGPGALFWALFVCGRGDLEDTLLCPGSLPGHVSSDVGTHSYGIQRTEVAQGTHWHVGMPPFCHPLQQLHGKLQWANGTSVIQNKCEEMGAVGQVI